MYRKLMIEYADIVKNRMQISFLMGTALGLTLGMIVHYFNLG